MTELPRQSNGERWIRCTLADCTGCRTRTATCGSPLYVTPPVRYSWTQPICDDCWNRQRPESPSPRAGAGEPEQCAWCGLETRSGIYLREDPDMVLFPAVLDG